MGTLQSGSSVNMGTPFSSLSLFMIFPRQYLQLPYIQGTKNPASHQPIPVWDFPQVSTHVERHLLLFPFQTHKGLNMPLAESEARVHTYPSHP